MKVTVLFFTVFILILGISYTTKVNHVLHLRIKAPQLEKKIKEEMAKKKQYELEYLIYASPERLLQLKEKPQYGHLDFPTKEQRECIQEEHAS